MNTDSGMAQNRIRILLGVVRRLLTGWKKQNGVL